MDEEIKVNGKLFAMRQTLAFLLARESVRANGPLDEIHSALVTEIMSACTQISDEDNVKDFFEAAVSSELDSLFGMAKVYYNVMPDR